MKFATENRCPSSTLETIRESRKTDNQRRSRGTDKGLIYSSSPQLVPELSSNASITRWGGRYRERKDHKGGGQRSTRPTRFEGKTEESVYPEVFKKNRSQDRWVLYNKPFRSIPFFCHT